MSRPLTDSTRALRHTRTPEVNPEAARGEPHMLLRTLAPRMGFAPSTMRAWWDRGGKCPDGRRVRLYARKTPGGMVTTKQHVLAFLDALTYGFDAAGGSDPRAARGRKGAGASPGRAAGVVAAPAAAPAPGAPAARTREEIAEDRQALADLRAMGVRIGHVPGVDDDAEGGAGIEAHKDTIENGRSAASASMRATRAARESASRGLQKGAVDVLA